MLNITHTTYITNYESLKSTGKCPTCNVEVFGTKYCCLKCVKEDKRKVKNRPSKTKLMKMIEETSYSAVGREYGVSDNAVRKWAKSYHLI